MKIVKVLGGLGNQMFQYALYVALCKRYPDEEVKIDINSFRGYGLHNGYELEHIFDLCSAPRATWRDVVRLAWPYFHYRLWQLGSRLLWQRSTMFVEPQNMAFCPHFCACSGDTYYDGYWQDFRYFAEVMDEVRATYTFPPLTDAKNKAVAQQISSTRSVALHIRRGDYLKHKKYAGTCSKEYYVEAIRRMEELHVVDGYFIFCNDAEWFHENVAPLLAGRSVTMVDWNHGKHAFRDMQLMSMSRHLIIANSTFSWWAAMLHQPADCTIIAPKKWYAFEDYHSPILDQWEAL